MKKPKLSAWGRLIEQMEATGLRQIDIARDIAQCHPQLVQDLKNGRTKQPSGLIAVRLYLHAAAKGMELPR